MAKRKNAGFKGAKEVRISNENTTYGRVRESVVKLSRDAWNGLPKDYDIAKREVKVLSIYKAGPSQRFAGTMYRDEQKMVLRDINHCDSWWYATTTVHELAHAWYNRQERLNPEKIEKWKKALTKINKPINNYVKRFIGSEWSFSTESHSAIAELVDTDKETADKLKEEREVLLNNKDFEYLKSVYLEIHGRV